MKSMRDSGAQSNFTLARATLITSFGDWLSYFAIIAFIYKTTGNVALAAYTVPLRSLSVGMGGLTTPSLMNRFSLRTIMLGSQWISAAFLVALAWETHKGLQSNPFVILGIVFVVTLLKQYFDTARETYSKRLAEAAEQRSLQAELLQGFYSAQFLGPLVAFAALQFVPVWTLIAFDALTFMLAAVICSKLEDVRVTTGRSVFAPAAYIWHTPGLKEIFFIRAIAFWIPTAIFNYVLFAIITQRYELSVDHSATIYALTGLGSFAAAGGG